MGEVVCIWLDLLLPNPSFLVFTEFGNSFYHRLSFWLVPEGEAESSLSEKGQENILICKLLNK